MKLHKETLSDAENKDEKLTEIAESQPNDKSARIALPRTDYNHESRLGFESQC